MADPLSPSRLAELLPAVEAAAIAAGQVIERVRAGHVAVDQKGDAGPVTEADRQADALLKARLTSLLPAAWLSEETADAPARLAADRLWVVDPLDGTKEFIRGLPEYVVAIALVEAGRPVLAVVHNPATGETWSALRGGGATREGRPLRVAEGRILLVSRSEVAAGEFAPFDAQGWEQRATGSIQYKLALLAEGRAAVTLSRGPKHEWDVCAGALLVTEAGGVATDLYGDPFRFNASFPKVRGVLAGAPGAVLRAAEVIARVGGSERMHAEFPGLPIAAR